MGETRGSSQNNCSSRGYLQVHINRLVSPSLPKALLTLSLPPSLPWQITTT